MLFIRELENIEADHWNQLVDSFPNKTLFHSYEWLEFLRKTFGLDPLHLGIYDQNRIVGIFPAVSCKKGGIFKIIASPLKGTHTAYMGPLVPSELLSKTLYSFYQFIKERDYDYVEITFTHRVEGNKVTDVDFHAVEIQTYLLELENDLDKMWGKLDSKCRNMVRKARKSGVEIIESTQREQIEKLYHMLIQTFAKSGIAPNKAKSFYYNLWDIFVKTGQLKILFARYEGELISGACFMHDDSTVYYLSGGSYREYLKYAPNNLIQWHIISWASENGLRYYNMYGAGSTGTGHFKKSFGPEVATYTYLWKPVTVKATLGRVAYSRIYKLKQKMQFYLGRIKF